MGSHSFTCQPRQPWEFRVNLGSGQSARKPHNISAAITVPRLLVVCDNLLGYYAAVPPPQPRTPHSHCSIFHLPKQTTITFHYHFSFCPRTTRRGGRRCLVIPPTEPLRPAGKRQTGTGDKLSTAGPSRPAVVQSSLPIKPTSSVHNGLRFHFRLRATTAIRTRSVDLPLISWRPTDRTQRRPERLSSLARNVIDHSCL